MSKRLEILRRSLENKQKIFDEKLKIHFETVRQANGQPLNDKRNGQATLNKWDNQRNSLRTMDASIEKTKAAIENEAATISYVERIKSELPVQILELLQSGVLTQWRKYPNMFFVEGVDKARIIWDLKKKELFCKYHTSITEKEQYSKFATTYNNLRKSLSTPTKQ